MEYIVIHTALVLLVGIRIIRMRTHQLLTALVGPLPTSTHVLGSQLYLLSQWRGVAAEFFFRLRCVGGVTILLYYWVVLGNVDMLTNPGTPL